jgi:hypothetical protein
MNFDQPTVQSGLPGTEGSCSQFDSGIPNWLQPVRQAEITVGSDATATCAKPWKQLRDLRR